MTTVCGSRLVFYVSGLKTLLQRVSSTRALSAAAFNTGKVSARPPDPLPSRAVGRTLGPLAPLTPMDCHLEALASTHRLPSTAPPTDHHSAATQGVDGGGEFFDAVSVECAVQPCPQRLAADVSLMFPMAPSSVLTVVTVTQRTQEDMSFWSSSVEEERENMLQTFIQGASQICRELQREGHWADFIEPSSGLPFFGPYTNLPLFETDERFSELGFSVDDLGCCRVLRHPVWGTHVFVGTIFTSAPAQGRGVMEALQGKV